MKRRWLLWLLLIALVWFVVSRFVQVEQFVATLRQGEWPWVVAAALLQFGHYVLYALLFQLAFAIVAVESDLVELLPVTFASLFVGVLAITGGAPLYVDDAARRGQSAARAAAGALLVLVLDFGTYALLLIAGLTYLSGQRALRPFELLGTAILLVTIAAMAAGLMLGRWWPGALRTLLGHLQQGTNALWRRFGRRDPLPGDWAATYTDEFTEAARDIATDPRAALVSLAVAVGLHLVDVVTLYALFLAFHQPARLGVLLAGYGIGILFWMVSITPQGIGVVEGVMALVFASLGVPAATATVISLAFRGVSFWLPLLAGVAFWPRVRSFGGR